MGNQDVDPHKEIVRHTRRVVPHEMNNQDLYTHDNYLNAKILNLHCQVIYRN